MRAMRRFLVLAACLAGGCTTTIGPDGTTTQVHSPLRADPPATLAPLTPPPGPFVPPPDGRYAGTGRQIDNFGANCPSTLRLSNFVVARSSVTFDLLHYRYRGTIQPDGSLTMRARQNTITGQFTGSRFEGRLWGPHRCTYTLTLDPV